MRSYSCTIEEAMAGRAQVHAIACDGAPLSWGDALAALRTDAGFHDYLGSLVAASRFRALRWETPPVTAATLGRPFAFVLVDDPWLDTDPEPGVFGPYFDAVPAATSVLALPNLGGDAQLVVPRGIAPPRVYAHFAAFLRGAPEPQVHALWRCVGETAASLLSARRLWISTAGGGVAWLHVRLENRPKYYAYWPYAGAE